MYRDPDEAAERRIEDLELRLKEQAEQIVELERRLDQRDDYVEALSRKLDGRSGHAARLWRHTALALLVAMAFVLIYAQSRGQAAPEPRAADPKAEPEAPLLADPVRAPEIDEPARQALDNPESDSRGGTPAESPPVEGSVADGCSPDDPLCSTSPWRPMSEQEMRLRRKLSTGTATADELRMLIALCNRASDDACRNQAFTAWKALQKSER